jgi:Holliday junction DNA helicase RuvB
MIDLEPYTAEELASMIAPIFGDRRPSQEVLLALARIGRLTPRTAIERAKEALDRHRFNAKMYPLSSGGLQRISAEQWKVDENGLTENDHRYLRALRDGAKGSAALTALLPVAKEEIERVIEPFLLQIEAIRVTPAGRVLTEQGRILTER